MKKKEIKVENQDFDPKKAQEYKDFSKVREGFENSPNTEGSPSGVGSATWILGALTVIVIVASLTWLFRKKDKNVEVDKVAQTEQNADLPLFKKSAPFEEYDVPFEIYDIPENGDVELLSRRGSIIRIPEGAFVDENGNDVTEDVEVWYREFHNPFEIFTAGIPMTTKTKDGNTQLESAGMFEIRAFQKGKPLQVKEGKFLDINLVSWNDDEKFNEYVLNENEDQWDYVDRAKLSDEDYVNPTTYRPSSEQFGSSYIEYEEEVSLLDETEQIDSKSILFDSLLYENPEVALDKKDYYFTVDMSKNDLPEFSDIGDVTFKVNTSKSKFEPSFYYVKWSSIEVSPNEGSDDYTLSLTKEDTSIQIVAKPIIDVKGNKERQADFAKKEAEKKKRNEERLSLTNQNSNVFLRPARSNRTNDMITSMINNSVDEPVYWNFTIAQVGYFNCDHPVFGDFVTSAFLDIVDQFGDNVEIAELYSVDFERNTVLYHGNSNMIRYNPRSTSVFWVITSDGNIGISNPNYMDRKKLKSNSKMEVTIHSADAGLRELKKIIG